MDEFRYPLGTICLDYLRAVFGAGLCAVPLVMVPMSSLPFLVLGVLVVCFLLFGALTWRRQLTRFSVGEDYLRRFVSPGWAQREFLWRDLAALRLAYFSVRRDGESGWMELKLRFGGSTVRVDSRLQGFITIATAAVAAAQRAGLGFDAATLSNIEALGIEIAADFDVAEEVAGQDEVHGHG